MTITTNITNNELGNGDNGLKLDSVTVVVNFQETDNYFGGQVILTKEYDSISLQSTIEEIKTKAIAKAKSLIANSSLPKTYNTEISNA